MSLVCTQPCMQKLVYPRISGYLCQMAICWLSFNALNESLSTQEAQEAATRLEEATSLAVSVAVDFRA